MKKQWTWIMILCVFNFTLMGFILTHPTSKNQDAKIVKKEEKQSFSFIGVGDNLYLNTQYMCQEQNEYYNVDSCY